MLRQRRLSTALSTAAVQTPWVSLVFNSFNLYLQFSSTKSRITFHISYTPYVSYFDKSHPCFVIVFEIADIFCPPTTSHLKVKKENYLQKSIPKIRRRNRDLLRGSVIRTRSCVQGVFEIQATERSSLLANYV